MTALCCLLCAIGCAPAGPTRYEVSGQVTLAGQPAPLAQISFRPDTSAGNDGPGSSAVVKNGQFKTASGKGVVAGAHEVSIIAYDGIPNSESANGKPLTNHPFTTKVIIPAENSVQNIDVPSSFLLKN